MGTLPYMVMLLWYNITLYGDVTMGTLPYMVMLLWERYLIR